MRGEGVEGGRRAVGVIEGGRRTRGKGVRAGGDRVPGCENVILIRAHMMRTDENDVLVCAHTMRTGARGGCGRGDALLVRGGGIVGCGRGVRGG